MKTDERENNGPMGKGVILYQSKYGAAAKYAEWLAEETCFDIMQTKEASVENLRWYDTIVLGGGVYASGIAGIGFLKKHLGQLKEKRIAVFCVGASPYEEKAFQELYARNFKDGLKGLPCFYCRGAWDEAEMSFPDRTMCRLLRKAVEKKDPDTLEPWEKALMEASGKACDWTDRRYLEPLTGFLREKG